MAETTTDLFDADQGSRWIPVRTLMGLRWVAIAGQIAAIVVAEALFNLDIHLAFCAAAVALSVIVNLGSAVLYPRTKRLSEVEATGYLLADLMQVGLLLAITGGLNNPFSILIIAPVTVAAMALPLSAMVLLGAAAVAITTIISTFHLPLLNDAGEVLSIPEIFLFGTWLAVVVSILFVSVYARRVSREIQGMSQALLATQMALGREQKLTDLGGVVAAYAHELGTPLATIKLVSSEMLDELEPGSDMAEDAGLIRDQADRCRDILRSMGRVGKDDLHLKSVPLTALIEEAAEPHAERGKAIEIELGEGLAERQQPMVLRRPELIHGLRNLIQNAVDFAASTVWIELDWSDSQIVLRIIDDGAGYPPHLLSRIGDPFLRTRRAARDRARPEYEGMGLGLFIAKTLLERTGAMLTFANGAPPALHRPAPGGKTGAIVRLAWPRGAGGIDAGEPGAALGENRPFGI